MIVAVNQEGISNVLHSLKYINRRIAKPAVFLILVMTLLLLQVSFPVSFVDAQNTNVTPMVSAGSWHSLALKKDGTVWAWGSGSSGVLGVGDIDNRPSPVQVSNLTGFKAVSAGHNHSLALKEDGTVWAWGNNWYGQLGDGTGGSVGDYSVLPVKVSGLADVQAVSAGHQYSLALKKDDTVFP